MIYISLHHCVELSLHELNLYTFRDMNYFLSDFWSSPDRQTGKQTESDAYANCTGGLKKLVIYYVFLPSKKSFGICKSVGIRKMKYNFIEPTCAHTRWALMRCLLSVCPSVCLSVCAKILEKSH